LRSRYPDRPVVGVGALVLEGGRILLVKRGYPPARGLWSLPGGHVDLGEGVLEAAARELLEETGVEGRPLGVVNVDNAVIRDEDGRIRYHYVLVTVLVERLRGEPRPASDAVDARFYALTSALDLELTESTRGLIGKILAGLIPIDRPCPVTTYTPPYRD